MVHRSHRGRYATWLTAGWGPVFLTGFAKSSTGKWRAASMPQWEAGKKVSANWGGSTLAAIKNSAHPKEAAELAIWLTTDKKATTLYTTQQFLFPVLNDLLKSPDFVDRPFEFYGGQPVNQVFAELANNVDPSFQWSPFQDYVNQTMGDELGAAANGKGTLAEAFGRAAGSVRPIRDRPGLHGEDLAATSQACHLSRRARPPSSGDQISFMAAVDVPM